MLTNESDIAAHANHWHVFGGLSRSFLSLGTMSNGAGEFYLLGATSRGQREGFTVYGLVAVYSTVSVTVCKTPSPRAVPAPGVTS